MNIKVESFDLCFKFGEAFWKASRKKGPLLTISIGYLSEKPCGWKTGCQGTWDPVGKQLQLAHECPCEHYFTFTKMKEMAP